MINVVLHVNGKKIIQNAMESIGYLFGKKTIKLNSILITDTKLNARWLKYLNIKNKTTKALTKKMEKFY